MCVLLSVAIYFNVIESLVPDELGPVFKACYTEGYKTISR
jgi:hypothetical protein